MKKTYSQEDYYLKLQQLREVGVVKSRAPLVSRLANDHEKIARLHLSVPTKIKDQYPELSKWEKLFVTNFYDGKPRPAGNGRMAKIREDIQKELARLYALAENTQYFSIDATNNPDLDRQFESEIKALTSRGEGELANRYKNNAEQAKAKMAKQYSNTLKEEYKHIVDFIKSTNYEPAFKALMLRETLLKTYKKTKDDNGEKTIVKPRVEHKTIVSHMTLNADVLNTIYNELDNYTSFANLYFAGIAISNKTIAGKNTISLTNVDTFGKGKWIKFESKYTNEEKYLDNSQELAALVQETPWCTKSLASDQLAQGDFYVFVDNFGKPHIAVKMSGNTVDEVRGIKGGNAQELEEDYRDVAIEFLTKNPDVKNGDEWLKKEEWNARLIAYIKQIESGNFFDLDIDTVLNDCFVDDSVDYQTHGGYKNSNKAALKENLAKYLPQIAEHYNCKPEEICFGDADYKRETKNPYVIILGDADFNYSEITDLGHLKTILGDSDFKYSQLKSIGDLQSIGRNADFRDSQITSLADLQSIGGYAWFNDSQITDIGNLKSIGKWVDFRGSQITSLANLLTIGGKADFSYSKITDLGKLQSIGGDAVFEFSRITNLANLQSIGEDAYFSNSHITDLGNLQSIGGNAYFRDSKITNLGKLQSIGGFADFRYSKITDLGNLQSIGGWADFNYSQIISLGNLQSIGGWADFRGSQITSLGSLQSIGGDVYFGDSKITSLGNLQSIGGFADFRYSKITDFGKLQHIGGTVKFGDNKELEKLFYTQFEQDKEGWKRKLTAKVEQDSETKLENYKGIYEVY